MTAAVQAPIKLSNGQTIPALGYGTWQAPPGVVGAALKVAITAGFRHIDCARIYCNEDEIGTALQELFAEGVVRREDLFITTKLWNNDHNPDVVESACRASLRRLKLDYVDLYLIHWPVAWKHTPGADENDGKAFIPRNEKGGCCVVDVPLEATWAAMEALVDAGLAKAIGISNYSIEQTRATVAAAKKHRPVTNQVEVHPLLPQRELQAACRELGIVLTAYCPLAIGMSPAETGLHADPALVAIAEETKGEADEAARCESAAELLLRWNLQQGNVVLTKSVTPERIAANAATRLGQLSDATLAKIDAFAAAKGTRRVCNPDFFTAEPNTPFFTIGGK